MDKVIIKIIQVDRNLWELNHLLDQVDMGHVYIRSEMESSIFNLGLKGLEDSIGGVGHIISDLKGRYSDFYKDN